MSEITITSFVDYEDKSGDLELIPLGNGARNLNHWDVKRWWYEGRTIYEACARVNNTDNGNVIYISSSTNNPYLKIEYDAGVYTFDGDYKREHIDRILIKTASDDIDIQIPLRGVIAPVTVSEPTEPLEIAPNGGANWVGGNKYEVGETVYGKTATFTGGIEPITYRWRIQTRASSSDSWGAGNGPWTNVTNNKVDISHALTEVGQVRIHSQARENNAPNALINSFTGGQNVTEPPIIGDITATVFGNPYDLAAAPALTVLTQDPIPVAVQKSGTAPTTYNWTVRGSATAIFDNPISASTDVTFVTPGLVSIQCTIQSADDIKTAVIQFYTVATFAELEALQG